MIVIYCTNPIFIHILPLKCPNCPKQQHSPSAGLILFSLSHRPPASGGEISTHSVNFPNGSCDLGNGRKGHQMSPDVKRCHQDLDFVNFVGINGLEMLWLFWLLWHVMTCYSAPKGNFGSTKAPHAVAEFWRCRCWSSRCSYTFSICQWHIYIYITIYIM